MYILSDTENLIMIYLKKINELSMEQSKQTRWVSKSHFYKKSNFTVKQISDEIKKSKGTIIKYLTLLEEKGLIIKDK